MPISPKTQAFMQPQSDLDAEQVFEQKFGEMAQGMLANKFPELLENVVTFKVINSDIDAGTGVGVFVASLNGQMVHVPVILSDNSIKPLELMYSPTKDMFMPLDSGWLDELSRDTVGELGTGVEAPRTLDPDADIRNLVVPPTTGRYAYASADAPGVMPGSKLIEFLSEAPNFVKRAFAKVLEKRHNVLKFAFENFDQKALLNAMRPKIEKTAASKESVAFLTTNNSIDEFKREFGKNASQAWGTATKHGFVVRDTRGRANIPVETEEKLIRTTVQDTGFYKVYLSDGSIKLAIVAANPQVMHSTLYAGVRGDIQRYPDQYRKWVKKQQAKVVPGTNDDDQYSERAGSPYQHYENAGEYLIYTEDGDIIRTKRRPVGVPVHASDITTGKFADLIGDTVMAVGTGTGIFARFKAGRVQATENVEVINVVTDSKGVRRIKTYGNTLVTDPNSPTNAIVAPTNGAITYVPPGFKFLKGEVKDDSVLAGADDSLRYLDELKKTGALRVRVRESGGLFYVGSSESTTKTAAIGSLVTQYGLRAKDAVRLVEKTASTGKHEFYLVNPEQMQKYAAWAKTAQPAPMAPPGQPGQPGPGMDPNAKIGRAHV